MSDRRIAVSRANYSVVVGLYGFDQATENYRYEPSLDAIDDAPVTPRLHLLTPADRRAFDEFDQGEE